MPLNDPAPRSKRKTLSEDADLNSKKSKRRDSPSSYYGKEEEELPGPSSDSGHEETSVSGDHSSCDENAVAVLDLTREIACLTGQSERQKELVLSRSQKSCEETVNGNWFTFLPFEILMEVLQCTDFVVQRKIQRSVGNRKIKRPAPQNTTLNRIEKSIEK